MKQALSFSWVICLFGLVGGLVAQVPGGNLVIILYLLIIFFFLDSIAS